MKDPNEKLLGVSYHIWIIFILCLGLALRVINLGVPLLWQDEAETAINGLSILKERFPSRTFKGLPIYENLLYIKSDDPMYEFSDASYLAKYKTYHGWAPLYVEALSYKLFTADNFTSRFPMVIFSLLSLILTYKLGELLYNRKVAIIALLIQALNPQLFSYYDRQARYYSMEIFFYLATFYSFLVAFRRDKTIYYILGGVSIALLFHTHSVASLISFLTVIAYVIVSRRSIKCLFSKKMFISYFTLAILTIPWIILVRFWQNKGNVSLTGLQAFSWNSIYQPFFLLMNHGSLYLVAIIGIIVLIANIMPMTRELMRRYKLRWLEDDSNLFLLAWVLMGMFILPFFMPKRAIHTRIFIILLPAFFIIISLIFNSMLSMSNRKAGKFICLIIILVLSFSSFGVPRVQYYHLGGGWLANFIKVIIGELDYGANWVSEVIAFLDSQKVPENTLVLCTSQHLSLLLYSKYPVQSTWPIRKSFIDNYDKELWVVEGINTEYLCRFFYRYVNPEERCGGNKNYYERASKGEKLEFRSGVVIYKIPVR